MVDISNFEMVLRLILAVVLGSAIGLERELKNQAAGLRTHIAVVLGAALIMLISKYGFTDVIINTKDPARLAAQVVSGIGFLGAGMIIVNRNKIRGLTTAASLWTTAAIGLAVGAGFYVPAVATTLILVFSLVLLKRFEWSGLKRKKKTMRVVVSDVESFMDGLDNLLVKNNILLDKTEIDDMGDLTQVLVYLQLPKHADMSSLVSDISTIRGVKKAEDIK